VTPEGKVKLEVKKLLKSFGERVYYFMPVQTGYGKAGVGDFVCCVNGKFLKIETKSPIGQETMLQEKDSLEVIKAGGVRLVIKIHDLERLEQIIKRMLEEV
jgi:hypothetical protein